jgi:hypothetical protein
MRLAEIANDVEQRRIEILKNNADRAKKQVKDAQAREKIKKGQEQLRISREPASNYSLNG